MRTLLIATLFFPVFSMASYEGCEGKVQALAQRGVSVPALEQAFRNTNTMTKLSRYLLLAEVGKSKDDRRHGTLQVVDLETGDVKVYPLQNGVPFNPRGDLDVGKKATTFYGMSEMNREMKAAPKTPSLKNFLHVGQQDEQSQDLQDCANWDKTSGNMCLSSPDYNEVRDLLLKGQSRPADPARPMEKSHQFIFTYPGINTQAQLKVMADRGGQPDTCHFLKKIPAPDAPGAPGSDSAKKGLDGKGG